MILSATKHPPLLFLLIYVAFALAVAVKPQNAHALMAGEMPDSPAQRTDPNTAASPFAGVGCVEVNGQVYSGTLIAPSFVLTAAHVAAKAKPENIVFVLNADGDASQRLHAAEIHVYPGYRSFGANRPAEGDLAVIRLAEPAASTVPNYGLFRHPLEMGTTLKLVAYGATGYGDKGAKGSGKPTVKRSGENNVDYQSHGNTGGPFDILYYFDFDDPAGDMNIMGGPSLGNTVETSLANGDSGSPAFVPDAQGHWVIAGVNTFRLGPDSTFGNGGGGQLVAPYADWIDGIVDSDRDGAAASGIALWPGIGVAVLGVSFVAWRHNSRATGRSPRT